MTRTIVLAGDSITDAGHREAGRAPLGDGYVAGVASALTELPMPWRVINAGIAGDRVRDLRERWDVDVEAERPDAVSILIGINDVWRRFSDGDPTSAADYRHGLRDIATRARDGGTRLVVLCEPFLLPFRDGQSEWVEDLDDKREVVKSVAQEVGATFIPLHDALTRDAATAGTEVLTTDGVHLTAAGHLRVATHWLAHVEPLLRAVG